MLSLWQDLRYGWRMLWQHRGLTLVAVVSLALGIGANIAIFSGVNAVYVRPFPVQDIESLVAVFTSIEGVGGYGTTSYPDSHLSKLGFFVTSHPES